MEKPKSVLHITSSYNGGIYSFIKSMMRSISPEMIKMDVAAFEEASEDVKVEVTRNQGKIYVLENPKKANMFKFFKNFLNIIDSNHYDVIHCHQMGHRALPFYLLAKYKKVDRFFIHAHSAGVTEVKQKKKTSVIHKIDQFINNRIQAEKVSCGEVATQYVFGNKAQNEVKRLTNSVDDKFLMRLENEQIIELKKHYHIPLDKIVMGQVGRLDRNKNQTFTIKLAEKISEISDQYYWILIGEGKDRKNLQEEIEQAGLSHAVRLMGRREDLEILYQLMDQTLLPSYTEGFGIAGVESQTAGVPCLASDTTSKEIDLGLGLVKFCSLNAPEEWVSEILKHTDHHIQVSDIKEKLYEKKYSEEQSAALYKEFVLNKSINKDYSTR